MDISIQPSLLQGSISAIPSKSQAHRLLICAAFADAPTTLLCRETNQDIEATADCLAALGADIQRTDLGYQVNPVRNLPDSALLHCRESGSTLRFLLPVVGALGIDGTFFMEGNLPKRPLSPLWEEMERMGCTLSRPSPATIRCQGRLKCGYYCIDGGISSQFISGLLFATALLEGESTVTITGKLESAPYVEMTKQALDTFHVATNEFSVLGGKKFHTPGRLQVEGDWSNAAFWLTAKKLGSKLEIGNLNHSSCQGDKAVLDFLSVMDSSPVIDATHTPDLVPILAIAAGACNGAVFTNCSRLRLKETDRLVTTCAMIRGLGGQAEVNGDTLTVQGTGYYGGIVDAKNDHRIAMSAAIAATVSANPVTILSAHEVKKSYPSFWEDYKMLGGHYEQYIR